MGGKHNMRLHEIFTDEEWHRLEQLIYATTWKALATYQQQRATQQRIATKPAATLKSQAAKKSKALARKAKRAPHAASPKALPKPVLQTRSQASTPQAYRPVKTAKPLPPTTRKAVANSQPAPKPTAPSTVMNLGDVDQATRQWLPADKRGQNPTDLLSLDERG
jgi:hypothetical protein